MLQHQMQEDLKSTLLLQTSVLFCGADLKGCFEFEPQTIFQNKKWNSQKPDSYKIGNEKGSSTIGVQYIAETPYIT